MTGARFETETCFISPKQINSGVRGHFTTINEYIHHWVLSVQYFFDFTKLSFLKILGAFVFTDMAALLAYEPESGISR